MESHHTHQFHQVPREVWADSVIATIPVGDLPVLIAFNPDNGDMYVANHDSDTVSVIDGQTNTVIGSPIPVGDDPFEIAFNPDNGDMYVTNHNSDTVSVIDGQTNTVIGSPIPVGDGPGGIAFNPDNGDMYVTNDLDDTVSVIQLLLHQKVSRTLSIPSMT